MLKVENEQGITLAFLNNITDAKVRERLNGEYTLDFTVTIDDLKTPFLYSDENMINYEDDLFRVVSIEELHNEDGQVTVSVACEHLSYDLLLYGFDNFKYLNKTAAEVMNECLLGTGFTLRYCDVQKKTDIQYEEQCNSKQISVAIANNWRGELKYYRRYIDLLARRGANRGTGFIFGKNLKSVKRIMNRAEKTVSYEVEISQGSEFEEFGQYELGDTVRIMDERLNVDIECRIIELEKDLVTGMNSKVVMGDQIKDMRSEFNKARGYMEEVGKNAKAHADEVGANATAHADAAANNAYNAACNQSMPYWNKLNAILDSLGNVMAGKLSGELKLNTTNILNSTGTFEQRDNGLYWQNQPTKAASTFATFWGAQGLMFARSKDANGEWKWETALSADGLIATKVLASALEGLTVTAVTSTASTMKTSTLEGCTIKGGELWIGTNADNSSLFSGCRVMQNGFIKGYINGQETYSLVHTNSGKLYLYSPESSGSITIDSFTGEVLNQTGNLILQRGIDMMSYDGRKVNTRIEIGNGNIDIMTFVNGGSNTGRVTISGDVDIRGNLSCWSCNTQG